MANLKSITYYWGEVFHEGVWKRTVGFFSRRAAVRWAQRVEYCAIEADMYDDAARMLCLPTRVVEDVENFEGIC